MARSGRSTTTVLAVLAAVLMIIAGTTAVTGWRSSAGPPGAYRSGAGGASTGRVSTDRVGADLSAAGASVEGASSLTAEPVEVPPPPPAARDPAVAARAGTLVARGGDLTVERVDLGAVTTVEVAGESRDVSLIYRVTVTAGPYQLRAMPAVLSVGGVAVGVAAEADDLASLVLYTYDDRVSVVGRTIELTYGPPGTAPTQWSTTIEALP